MGYPRLLPERAVTSALRFPFFAILFLAVPGCPAIAAAPDVALVEEISGDAGALQPFDMLAAGQTFHLPAGGSVTLGFWKACAEEVVTGGEVTVTADGAQVKGGRVDRREVACPPVLKPRTAEAQQAGAVVLRAPQHVAFPAVSPFLVLPGPGSVTCEDATGAWRQTIPVAGHGLDLGGLGIALKRGQSYRLVFDGAAGSSEILLHITPEASASMPLLSRTIRF
jgi:hypothetical protein